MEDVNQKDAVAFFLSFCIELYKNANSLSGKQSYELLAKSGALSFLEENYKVIHTQSPQWILEEIEEYITSKHTSKL